MIEFLAPADWQHCAPPQAVGGEGHAGNDLALLGGRLEFGHAAVVAPFD